MTTRAFAATALVAILSGASGSGCGGLASTLGSSGGPNDHTAKSKSQAAPAPDPARAKAARDQRASARDQLASASKDLFARRPVPTETLEKLAASATGLREIGVEAAATYASYLGDALQLHNLWQGGHAREELPRWFGAEAMSDAALPTIPTQADHCYVVMFQMRDLTQVVKHIEAWRFESADAAPLERFRLTSRLRGVGDGRGNYGAGFCTATSSKVATRLEIATGKGNGVVDLLVLDAKRTAFPARWSRDLQVDISDRCDTETWSSMWRQPLPGSLVFAKGRPLLRAENMVQGHRAQFWDLQGKRTTVAPEDVSNEPPSSWDLGKESERTCERTYPHRTTSLRTRRLAECYVRVNARFMGPRATERNVMKNGKTALIRLQAQDRLEKLKDQQRVAAAGCDGEQSAILEEFRALHDTIGSHYRSHAPVPTFDRAASYRELTLGAESLANTR